MAIQEDGDVRDNGDRDGECLLKLENVTKNIEALPMTNSGKVVRCESDYIESSD